MTGEQLASALIFTATNFVGLEETKQNREFDDPRTKAVETEISKQLVRDMSEFGWKPGEPYCAAFLGAVVSMTARSCGLPYDKFRSIWTAGCMRNVRNLQALSLLDKQPSRGALMLFRYKETQKGHAALVCEVEGKFPNRNLITIEGNTMVGRKGDQRQGDGIYQKIRNVTNNGSLVTQGFLSATNLLSLLSK
jgi:hypothetical protein